MGCWSYDAKKRMNVSCVVDTLLKQPGLLTPCLDAPSSSIDVMLDDNNEQFSVSVANNRERHSISSGKLKLRISSEPTSNMHSSLSQEGKFYTQMHSPTSSFYPPDPFSLINAHPLVQQNGAFLPLRASNMRSEFNGHIEFSNSTRHSEIYNDSLTPSDSEMESGCHEHCMHDEPMPDSPLRDEHHPQLVDKSAEGSNGDNRTSATSTTTTQGIKCMSVL